MSWMNSEAISTSRQIRLCRSSSGTNHLKPKRGGWWSISSAGADSADGCTLRMLAWNRPATALSSTLSGESLPAPK
ncbi:hypothetical protein [Sedimenticola hydrogenitrophicus]|uniref:hypothetical protein n=1 Tax=Sedimenticola hydrogenitrophicus TaxID=2967975 RepID=UPI003AAF424D